MQNLIGYGLCLLITFIAVDGLVPYLRQKMLDHNGKHSNLGLVKSIGYFTGVLLIGCTAGAATVQGLEEIGLLQPGVEAPFVQYGLVVFAIAVTVRHFNKAVDALPPGSR